MGTRSAAMEFKFFDFISIPTPRMSSFKYHLAVDNILFQTAVVAFKFVLVKCVTVKFNVKF